jgi:hypothetical protein
MPAPTRPFELRCMSSGQSPGARLRMTDEMSREDLAEWSYEIKSDWNDRAGYWYNSGVIQIADVIVRDGQVELPRLPFADGQHVRITIDALPPTRNIHEVRELLKNGVERFDEPFEPMIPTDSWEMQK